MKFTPKEHQELGIEHLKTRKAAALFAGMGLGKTTMVLSALDWLMCDGAARGILIVAPLRVAVLTWPDEVAKWDEFNWLRVANLRTEKGKQDWVKGTADVFVINYEALPKFSEQFIKGVRSTTMPVDTVLFDEIDNAKNPGSKRINAFRKYAPKFRRRWGMTGTPSPNSRQDVFAQIRLLDDGESWKCPANPNGNAFGPWKKQHFQVSNPGSDYPKYEIRPGSEQAIEEAISHLALVLRSEDWLHIPPVITEDIPVTLPAEGRKFYKKLEKELLVTLEDESEVVAITAAVLAGKLSQVTGGAVYTTEGEDGTPKRVETLHRAKLDALRALQRREGAPLLVACQFRHEISRILEDFPEAELFSLDNVDKWNRGEIPILVAHPKSISHGLNLQAGGSRVVWFTLGHARGLYDQFNARLARQGQEHETKIFRLICPGTIDDAIAENLRHKAQDQSDFLAVLKNLKRLAAA